MILLPNSLPPTLTLPRKGGGKLFSGQITTPSPSMGEGGVGVTLSFPITEAEPWSRMSRF